MSFLPMVSEALTPGDLLQAELLVLGAGIAVPPIIAEGQLRAKDMRVYFGPCLVVVEAIILAPFSTTASFYLAVGAIAWMTGTFGLQLAVWQTREERALQILSSPRESEVEPSPRQEDDETPDLRESNADALRDIHMSLVRAEQNLFALVAASKEPEKSATEAADARKPSVGEGE